MAGLLTHLSVAFAGWLLFMIIFKSYKYGLAFALGHLIPDLIDFGIAGIMQGSLSPGIIMTNPIFHVLAILGHTFTNWLIFTFIVLAVIYSLHYFKKVSGKTFKMLIIILAIFLTGVAMHLVLDVLIIETSYWI